MSRLGVLQISVSSLAVVAGLAAVAWLATDASSNRPAPTAVSVVLANAQAGLQSPVPEVDPKSPAPAAGATVTAAEEARDRTAAETAARDDSGSELLASASPEETSASTGSNSPVSAPSEQSSFAPFFDSSPQGSPAGTLQTAALGPFVGPSGTSSSTGYSPSGAGVALPPQSGPAPFAPSGPGFGGPSSSGLPQSNPAPPSSAGPSPFVSGPDSPPPSNSEAPPSSDPGPLSSSQPGTQTQPPSAPPIIAGTDPIPGDLHVAPNQLHSPGHSPGQQSIGGDYILDGTLRMELAGTIPGLEYDQLLVDGKAILNGEIDVVLLHGFVPELSDVFDLIIADDGFEFGDLFSIVFPELPNGNHFEYGLVSVDDGRTAFRIYDPPAAAAPEPATLTLVGVAFAGFAWIRRKSRGTIQADLVG